ncbi:hypothetical protein GCM10023403_23550 [Pseudonocardia benzenivorans]
MWPEGANGFSVGPGSPVIAAANPSWSPAACCRTWVTVHSEHGVGSCQSSSPTAATATRSASWARSMTAQVVREPEAMSGVLSVGDVCSLPDPDNAVHRARRSRRPRDQRSSTRRAEQERDT